MAALSVTSTDDALVCQGQLLRQLLVGFRDTLRAAVLPVAVAEIHTRQHLLRLCLAYLVSRLIRVASAQPAQTQPSHTTTETATLTPASTCRPASISRTVSKLKIEKVV